MVSRRIHLLPEVAVELGRIVGESSTPDARVITEHLAGLCEVASVQWPQLMTNGEGSWIAEAAVGADQRRLGVLSILIEDAGWLERSPAVRLLAVSWVRFVRYHEI